MNPALLSIVYRPSIGRAARAGLVGRNRNPRRPEAGRFTNADVSHMLERVWASYDELSPAVPRGATVGSRMNLLLSCMTYACLRALLSMGVERVYAIELIGDVAWKLYEKWGRLPRVIARIGAHDPREQMRIAVNLFLRFPFGPPGYQFERLPSSEGVSLNMLRCPIADYFKSQDASDLCVGTWCNLDFALAEMWGGRLERHETLSAGCVRCDFRFKGGPAIVTDTRELPT